MALDKDQKAERLPAWEAEAEVVELPMVEPEIHSNPLNLTDIHSRHLPLRNQTVVAFG